MRVCFIIFMVFAAILGGCNSCHQLNEFGRCVDNNECRRPAVFNDWKIKIGQADVIDVEILEKADFTFVWTDVYAKFMELRKSYVPHVKNCNQWCRGYSACNVTNQSWVTYWQEMVNVAIDVLIAKKVMVERLGYLLSQERMNEEQQNAAIATVEHLASDDLQGEYLLKIVKELRKQKVLPKIENQKKLKKYLEEFKEAVYAARDRVGKVSEGSESLIKHIQNSIDSLKKIPSQK